MIIVNEIPGCYGTHKIFAESRRNEILQFLSTGEKYAELERFEIKQKAAYEMRLYKSACDIEGFKEYRKMIKFHVRKKKIYVERIIS